MSVRSMMQSMEGMDNIFVIPSGKLPPNPTELLASAKMSEILNEAGQDVDVIIVDCPPSLVADYQVLATKMDGVVMVVQPGFTHIDASIATLEQLKRVNARVLGVVMNKIERHNHYYPYKRGEYYSQQTLEVQPFVPAARPDLKLLPQAQPVFADNPAPQVETESSVAGREEDHDRKIVHFPRRDVFAAQNTVARSRPRRQVLQGVEPVAPLHTETETKPAIRVDEPNEYVIPNYKLEYWIGNAAEK
jgi:hypothetical protein